MRSHLSVLGKTVTEPLNEERVSRTTSNDIKTYPSRYSMRFTPPGSYFVGVLYCQFVGLIKEHIKRHWANINVHQNLMKITNLNIVHDIVEQKKPQYKPRTSYQCQECGKTVVRKDQLVAHLRTHSSK